MKRHIGLSVLAIIGMVGAVPPALAQVRVAPPGAVDSAPLAPPPGSNQAQAEPQPVQPPPIPSGPITPQPVQPPPTAQTPLEPTPVQPPPTLPLPPGAAVPGPQPPAPLPPPQAPLQQRTEANPNATLAGKPGDPSDVDEVPLVSKPVLVLSGQSSWDQGFQKPGDSMRILREEAARAGLAIAGRPLTVFVQTDDDGFRFEAMLPVAGAGQGAPLGNGVRAGMSPAGASLRFVHTAPYDDIDSTYETITAYLEAKNIKVKDGFIEEYVSDLKDPLDPNLEINVYVQPQ